MGASASTTEPQPAAGAKPLGAGEGAKAAAEGTGLVAVGDVIKRRGHIAVTGRYSCERLLEDDYIIEPKVVGSGMSGPVQLATCKADNKKCAVKSFKKTGLSTRKRNELKSEVEIYLGLDHPHIARLERVYETAEEAHLVMEYMAGGELYDRLSERKQYTEEDAADTTHQMLLAVAYLHGHQIAHRDLKLENFLYEAKNTNHLKLIDFGFAKFWDRSATMSQACGSVHYVAPEVLAHSYTEKADLWSLGVIVYMLVTGSPPFHGSDSEVLKKIKAGTPHWSSRFKKLTLPAQQFVQALLVVSPKERLSAEEALEHQWIKNKNNAKTTELDLGTLQSLRSFAHASGFRRAVLSMMAWSLSTEERVELRQQFLAMDTENKGTITHTQMKKVLEENFRVDNYEAEALFKSLDTDNDNEIAYSEFLAAALQGRVKVHENLLRKTFAKFDVDDCGRISAADLRSVLGDDFEGADVEALIQEADTDKDGSVDYDEFLRYFHKCDEAAAEDDLALSGGGSRKHQHTEKLGVLLDKLLVQSESQEELEPGSPTASPGSKTPKPLLSRGAKKHRTADT